MGGVEGEGREGKEEEAAAVVATAATVSLSPSSCASSELFSSSRLFFRFSHHLFMSQADNNGLWGTVKNQTIVVPGVK